MAPDAPAITPPATNTAPRGSVWLAAALFTLSGALGLGYQLVWIRKATLVVGASQIALSTVLTSFFLGLALGSLVAGRRLRSRRLSPLFVYGLCEAGIGLYALAFPALFTWIEATYGVLYGFVAASGEAILLLRFGLLFALFLAPTFLMGATLPLLLDGLVGSDASVGSRTSLLYGLNILGAVLGVLVTGYFAIPELGMNGTSRAAGIGNLSIAALALVAFRRTTPLHPLPERGVRTAGPSLFFCALAFLSGLTAIGYQVAWARYFSLFKTSSVHLTTILLAVYLSGLTAGSLLMARLLAVGVRPLRVIALLQPLAAILVLQGLGWWSLADYELRASSDMRVQASWHLVSEVADSLFCAPLFQVGLVILLPVTLLGTALPGIIAAATRTSAELRGSAGQLVFWNTLGASAGGFAAGYLLIPSLGLGGTLFALTLLCLGLAGAAESRLSREARPSRRLPLGPGHLWCALALLATAPFLRSDVTWHTVRTQGVARHALGAELVDVEEGPLATVSVFAGPMAHYIASGNQMLAFVHTHQLPIQAIQGHLPALFYPREGTPERVLGIALGSGQSFGALLRYPIRHMDVVDISSEMVRMALRHFRRFHGGLDRDPRVRVHLDDGRHFVARAPPESYDVVSMEPPPPTNEGVHALYSIEFYLAIHRILRADGVLMQWLPPYGVTPNEARSVLKTQASVFPQTFLVRTGPDDFMTLSFKRDHPPRFSTRWIRERARIFEQERLVRKRRWTPESRYPTASLEGILALLTAGPESIARMSAPYIYRDDDQRLSYSSGDRHLLRRYSGTQQLTTISFMALPLTSFAELQRYFIEPLPAGLEEERARALSGIGIASPVALASAERRFREAADANGRAQWALAIAELHGPDVESTLRWLHRAIEANPAASAGWLRRWVRDRVEVHAAELQRWIDGLTPAARASALARTVERGLERHAMREHRRRSQYLWWRFLAAWRGAE